MKTEKKIDELRNHLERLMITLPLEFYSDDYFLGYLDALAAFGLLDQADLKILREEYCPTLFPPNESVE